MCMVVYHNSRWGKSRQVVQLLRDNNINHTIIEYLKEPISTPELTKICKALKLEPINLVRTQDKNFKALNIDIIKLNNAEIIDLIIKNPKILERPIILKNKSGVIGRPPENIKKLF